MAVCYNKLWKLLIDKEMTKTQLCKAAKVSTNAVAKMGRNEDVRVDVLVRICEALECNFEDIMELKMNRSLKRMGALVQIICYGFVSIIIILAYQVLMIPLTIIEGI